MKKKSGKGKMRALAVLLAVALVVTGINLPFSVGSLQAAAQENGTGEVQEQNQDEPDTQEPDTGDSAVTELTLQGSGTAEVPYKITSAEELENFQAYVNSGGDTQGKYFLRILLSKRLRRRLGCRSAHRNIHFWEPSGLGIM